MNIKTLLICGFLASMAQTSNSAEIRISSFQNLTGNIVGRSYHINGEILKGDSQKLKNLIILQSTDVNSIITLNSPGGSVQEGILLGEIVKAARLETWVQSGQTCASACFFIWINGANRFAPIGNTHLNANTKKIENPKIGLHRPYFKSIENNDSSIENQANLLKIIDQYLSEKRIPRRLIDILMNRASNDIYWLNADDLMEIGESPYELEELYISKCNDNRKQILQQLAIANSEKNQSLTNILENNMASIYSCIEKINDYARQKAIAEKFLKLQKQ